MQTIGGNGYSDPHDMEKAIVKVMKWLINFTMRVVATRKTDTYYKRPGSATVAEPKFIWVKMLPRNIQDKAEFFRETFNNILEAELADRKHNYIMDLSKIVFNRAFDQANNLSIEARNRFLGRTQHPSSAV